MLEVDPSEAFAAGLHARPLDETARDTLAWIRAGESPQDTDAGLDPTKERRVLDSWASKE
jgi:hypothetical protein